MSKKTEQHFATIGYITANNSKKEKLKEEHAVT